MFGARNETIITEPDGREHRLLFTNRALAEAERTTGKSMLEVLDGFAINRSGINELAHMMRAGLESARRDGRAGGKAHTLNDAFDILDAVGFPRVLEKVLESVGAVLGYGADDEPADDDPNA